MMKVPLQLLIVLAAGMLSPPRFAFADRRFIRGAQGLDDVDVQFYIYDRFDDEEFSLSAPNAFLSKFLESAHRRNLQLVVGSTKRRRRRLPELRQGGGRIVVIHRPRGFRRWRIVTIPRQPTQITSTSPPVFPTAAPIAPTASTTPAGNSGGSVPTPELVGTAAGITNLPIPNIALEFGSGSSLQISQLTTQMEAYLRSACAERQVPVDRVSLSLSTATGKMYELDGTMDLTQAVTPLLQQYVLQCVGIAMENLSLTVLLSGNNISMNLVLNRSGLSPLPIVSTPSPTGAPTPPALATSFPNSSPILPTAATSSPVAVDTLSPRANPTSTPTLPPRVPMQNLSLLFGAGSSVNIPKLISIMENVLREECNDDNVAVISINLIPTTFYGSLIILGGDAVVPSSVPAQNVTNCVETAMENTIVLSNALGGAGMNIALIDSGIGPLTGPSTSSRTVSPTTAGTASPTTTETPMTPFPSTTSPISPKTSPTESPTRTPTAPTTPDQSVVATTLTPTSSPTTASPTTSTPATASPTTVAPVTSVPKKTASMTATPTTSPTRSIAFPPVPFRTEIPNFILEFDSGARINDIGPGLVTLMENFIFHSCLNSNVPISIIVLDTVVHPANLRFLELSGYVFSNSVLPADSLEQCVTSAVADTAAIEGIIEVLNGVLGTNINLRRSGVDLTFPPTGSPPTVGLTSAPAMPSSPTTSTPTTSSPKTAAPTTDAPNISSPKTEAPTTDLPATASPTTVAHAVVRPTVAPTSSPTTASRTTSSPTTPTTSLPMMEELKSSFAVLPDFALVFDTSTVINSVLGLALAMEEILLENLINHLVPAMAINLNTPVTVGTRRRLQIQEVWTHQGQVYWFRDGMVEHAGQLTSDLQLTINNTLRNVLDDTQTLEYSLQMSTDGNGKNVIGTDIMLLISVLSA